jgi:hypothetical protein
MSKGTCKLENCAGPVVGKGYCARHYKQWRRGDLPKGRYKICTAEGCRKPRAALGSKCEEHRKTASSEGAATPAPPPAPSA